MFQAPKLTDGGKALYYENLAGEHLVFTTIKLGSGTLSEPIATLTDLVNTVVTIEAAATVYDQYVDVAGAFSNADLATGFYWREIGVFAQNPKDPDNRAADILYCYQNAYDTADYIPVASVETVEKNITVPVIVGDAAAVSCILSGSLVYVTRQALETHNADENAHADMRALIQANATAAAAAQETADQAMEKAEENTGGCVLQITFESAFSGRPYTVTSEAGESYAGTVPAGLYAEVSVKNTNTTYTIRSTNSSSTAYSETVTTDAYFGQYPVLLTDFLATLNVTTSVGATVTATSGGNTYTAIANADGLAILTIDRPRTYTVTATLNGETETGSIEITTSGSTYSLTLTFVSTILNVNTWEKIREVSDTGTGANYWSVGDTKTITINGTVGNNTFSNLAIDVFIIGFNHNSSREGTNRIHFQIGKIGGTPVALVGGWYDSSVSANGYFSMNSSDTNLSGWANCQMRATILGSHYEPTNPATTTLLAALPADLRAVMKSCKKYSDNVGGGSDTASYVMATTDYLFLLSEWEYHGARSFANSAEQNYQAQYAYYQAGNSKIKYRYNASITGANFWCRSINASDTSRFCLVVTNGTAATYNASASWGVAPGFCV